MGPVRVVAACIAAGALAGSVVLSLLWLLQPESYWFVLVTSYTPYAVPGYLIALAGLGILRWRCGLRWRSWVTGGVLLAVAGTALHVALLAPAFLGEHPEGEADLTVLSVNAGRGGADAEALVTLARAEGADVLIVAEATPALEQELSAAGVEQSLPHLAGTPAPGSAGTLVYAAFPLAEAVPLPLEHGSVLVQVQAPTPLWLVAVHLAQPLEDQGTPWREDWDVVQQVAEELEGPVVVAGDFNSTLEHRPVRALLGAGYADAARESNAGWQPTYPSSWGLIAIDHVLSKGGYQAAGTSTHRLPGTDHRGLVARLVLPRDPQK